MKCDNLIPGMTAACRKANESVKLAWAYSKSHFLEKRIVRCRVVEEVVSVHVVLLMENE